MDTQALWLTLRLALTTTALLLAIALPLAWWMTASSCGRDACIGAGTVVGAAASASANSGLVSTRWWHWDR